MQVQGQSEQDTLKNPGMAAPDLMAKPAFEGNSDNFHIRVWVMSARNENRDAEMAGNNGSDDKNEGTHNIIVELTDVESGREIPGATVKILSLSPSGKKTSIELESMMNHYGGDIDIEEKGEYQFDVSVQADGNSTLTPFVYDFN